MVVYQLVINIRKNFTMIRLKIFNLIACFLTALWRVGNKSRR